MLKSLQIQYFLCSAFHGSFASTDIKLQSTINYWHLYLFIFLNQEDLAEELKAQLGFIRWMLIWCHHFISFLSSIHSCEWWGHSTHISDELKPTLEHISSPKIAAKCTSLKDIWTVNCLSLSTQIIPKHSQGLNGVLDSALVVFCKDPTGSASAWLHLQLPWGRSQTMPAPESKGISMVPAAKSSCHQKPSPPSGQSPSEGCRVLECFGLEGSLNTIYVQPFQEKWTQAIICTSWGISISQKPWDRILDHWLVSRWCQEHSVTPAREVWPQVQSSRINRMS